MNSRYIIVEYGAPHVVNELPSMRPNRLAVMARTWEQVHAFDERARYRIQPRSVPSYGMLTKVMAHTVFNPSEELDFDWQTVSDYRKDDVIRLVDEGLEHDDDIIQQWFDAAEVLTLLNAADTWDKLLVAVDAVCGGHESDPDTQRYVDSVLGNRA